MIKKLKKIIVSIEEDKRNILYLIVFFIFICARIFIEPFSIKSTPDAVVTIHWFFFYFVIILSYIIVVAIITKIEIIKVTRIFFLGSFLIILAPLIDLLLSGGAITDYIKTGNTENIFYSYITFMGNIKKNVPGVTSGMRIEIAIILFLISVYVIIKTRNFFKSLFSIWILYTLGFFIGALPYFTEIIYNKLDLFSSSYSSLDLTFIFFIFTFLLLILYFLLYNKNYFIAFWKNFPLFRALHYYGMFFYGFIISNGSFNFKNILDVYSLITALLSILSAGIVSIIINDINDYEIDKISNPSRPLVDIKIPKKEYKIIAIFCFIICIIYSFFSRANGLLTMMLCFVFVLNYSLYSAPPLRMKRFPFLSKLIIGFNSLIILVYGYYFNKGSFENFPLNLIIYILIFLSLAINFIDLKDYEGDKLYKIKTLPVLFGLSLSKKIIGFFVLLAFFLFPFFIRKYIFLPEAILSGILAYFFINKKNYREFPVFLIYIMNLYSIIFLQCFGK